MPGICTKHFPSTDGIKGGWHMKNGIFVLIVLFACCAVSNGKAHKKSDIDSSAGLDAKEILDVPFAEEPGVALRLDLFLPVGVKEPPLVVFIHGGGWTGGSRKNCPVKWLVQGGGAPWRVSNTASQARLFSWHRYTIAREPSAGFAPMAANTAMTAEGSPRWAALPEGIWRCCWELRAEKSSANFYGAVADCRPMTMEVWT